MEEKAQDIQNKEDIGELKREISDLRKENITLRPQCLEKARHKRTWDLRVIGLPEKEDTRDPYPGDSVVSGEASAVCGHKCIV